MQDKTANFFSLFASTSTLICCALPAIFVAIGAQRWDQPPTQVSLSKLETL